jgi:hypothetical protein
MPAHTNKAEVEICFCGLGGKASNNGDFEMNFQDMQQQNGLHNPAQWGWSNTPNGMFGQRVGGFGPQIEGLAMPGIGFGPTQGAFGSHPTQNYGPQTYAYGNQFGQPLFGAVGQTPGWGGQSNWGAQSPWGQQRQLTHHDIGEVVRQLVPLLPHIVAQAQQPLAAYGYGPFGYGVANQQRLLSQHDINEVVRQILPILPQIVGALQGQAPLHLAAMHAGHGYGAAQGPFGQNHGAGANPYLMGQQANPFGNPFGQPGWLAFGNQQNFGPQIPRQLTPQDTNEVVRQLLWAIPQVIGNLQAYGQQRAI